MIFATVGAQMAFDRLIRPLDAWAGRSGRDNILAQIGPANWCPQHVRWVRFLEPQAFRTQVSEARLIVAHAGMGSILTALEFGKPILVMPRRAGLGETRNDHQIATARYLLAQGRVHVAFDVRDLVHRLERLDELNACGRIESHASPQLIAALRAFINSGQLPVAPCNPPV